MSTTLFDPARPAHVAALNRLPTERIAWLSFTDAAGAPHSVPVWFFWRDGLIYIVSEPATGKVRSVRRDGRVQLNLESDPFGNEVVIIEGRAELSDRPSAYWLAEFGQQYLDKYGEAIAAFGMPLAAIAEKFSVTIVVTPTKVRAW